MSIIFALCRIYIMQPIFFLINLPKFVSAADQNNKVENCFFSATVATTTTIITDHDNDSRRTTTNNRRHDVAHNWGSRPWPLRAQDLSNRTKMQQFTTRMRHKYFVLHRSPYIRAFSTRPNRAKTRNSLNMHLCHSHSHHEHEYHHHHDDNHGSSNSSTTLSRMYQQEGFVSSCVYFPII